jgi:hypothetical protein
VLMLKIGHMFFCMHYHVGAKVVAIIRAAHGLQEQPAIILGGRVFIHWQFDVVSEGTPRLLWAPEIKCQELKR